MINAVIFDWGGVLITKPNPRMIAYCTKYFDIAPDLFINVIQQYKVGFQKGVISEDEFWEHVCAVLGVPKPAVSSLWGEAFASAYQEQKEVFDLAGWLQKNGYTIGVLSNTELPAVQVFYEQQYTLFDECVFSCHEGTVKPERRIYTIILEKLGVDPDNTVFIDDRKEFIDGAQQLGIHTIQFQNVDQLKQALHQYAINYD